ncbi:MAG: NUDIX domain-containing protein [Myxococcales bacterium]|nr:NUDIX domain-containing protein [Myxococcales bacterium]MCC6521056.1 NUDIX domain-containing protein [Polyangiaceae bacterium]
MGLGRAYDPHFELHRVSRRRAGVWQTAGGVVFDPATGDVLLVKIRRELARGRSGWTWPKGRIDVGEGPMSAALREIEEETGVVARAVEKLSSFRTARALRHYYLCALSAARPHRCRETLEVRWVPLKRAKALLDRKRDLGVLRAAKRALARQAVEADTARAA